MGKFLDLLDAAKSSESIGGLYRGIRVGYGEMADGSFQRGNCLVSYQENPNSNEVSIAEGEDEEIRFEWGNKTSMSKNLSRTLLRHYFRPDSEVPEILVKLFCDEFISACDFEGWALSESTLRLWLQRTYESVEESL